MLNGQASGIFEDQTADSQSQMGFFSFPPPNNLSMISGSSVLLQQPQLLGYNCSHQISLKTLISASSSVTPSDQLLYDSNSVKLKEDHHILDLTSSNYNYNNNNNTSSSLFGAAAHLLSLQRSSNSNLWEWGEMNNEESCMVKKKNNNIMKRSSSDHHHHHQNVESHNLGIISGGMGMGMGMGMKMKKIRRKVREPRFCFKTMSDVDVLEDGYKWRKYGQKVVKNTLHPRSYYRCTQDNCRVKKRVERLADDPRMVITTYEGRHVHSPSQDEDDLSQAASSQLCNFFW